MFRIGVLPTSRTSDPVEGVLPTVRTLDPGEAKRPFAQLRQRMTDVLGDGGLMKEVVHPGEGPPVPQNASVLMHYSGFLEYDDQPFETTTHYKYPQMMKLGRDVTLIGLELGLLTMRRGEYARFLIQPQYAYGAMGCPPIIPGAATALYEVHVAEYYDSRQLDDIVKMSPEEHKAVPLSTLLEVVNTLRSFGNRCFSQGRFDHARERYKQALELLVNREDDAEREGITGALLLLYMNLSLSELRLDSPSKALKYGKKALEIDLDNTKALYRCAQAYMELQDYESAQSCLVLAQAKKPFDTDINNLLKKAATCCKDHRDKEKDMCSKMFKNPEGPVKM